MAEASHSPPLGPRDPPDSSSSAPAPSTPIPDTEELPVPTSKSRRRRGNKRKKNARSSSVRSTGSDTENPTTPQATQLADASSPGGEAQEEQQEEEQQEKPPPPAPPPSPISHGQWSPPLPPLGKLQGKVVIEPNKAIAAQFAKTYSDRRNEDNASRTLPIFTDGSASPIINAAKARFCSASTVFRAHPTSDSWIERGYPLLLAIDSLNAEVFGLGRGLRDGRDYIRAHPEMRIATLLVFTDVMKFLEMLPRIEKGEWDVVKRGYVEEFLALDAELVGELGVSVEYHWVPGHSGVEGNDRADRASRRCRPDVMYPEVFQTLPFPSREEQLLNQQAKLERKRKHEENFSRAMSKRSKKRVREEEET